MAEKLPHAKIESGGEPSEEVSQSERLRKVFEAANEHRDFSIYTRLMDAALEAKAESLFPHFSVEEGDVVVDAGSGTGALAELAAREFRDARVYALDISHELQDRAEEGKALTHLVYGDAADRNFPENSVKVKYYSTSGHEIESFGGEGSMRRAMENTFRELVPGGRVIIRDFAKPSGTEPIFMKIISNVGLQEAPVGMKDEDIDYSMFSTGVLLDRFQKEFRGGDAFFVERVEIEGEEYIKIDQEWAHEFYLRKDYTANWRQEIKEKYTYWTPEQAKRILEEIGYVNVRVIPDPNDFILRNRLEGKIELYEMSEGGNLARIPFPMTHMVVVGEKQADPKQKEGRKEKSQGVDYGKIFSSIEFDEKRGVVRIGRREFEIDRTKPIVGTKKIIFGLQGEPPRVLKVARADTRNDHNVFKSMFQIVERQDVLYRYKTPHLKIVEHDLEGPPFRYVVQEAVPKGAVSAADLIGKGMLGEEDIKQMARAVNAYEKGKEWQLDTNPFSWFRVQKGGGTEMVYVSGKVYRYDEQWEFKKVGLLQWIDSQYVKQGQNFSAAIPTSKAYEKLRGEWKKGGGIIDWWKKYLDSATQP